MIPLDAGAVQRILQGLETLYPRARCELVYQTPFQLLVATMLSAQTTDQQVNDATKVLFRDCPTPDRMVQLDEDTLVSYLRRLGLFRTKARHVLRMCHMLMDEYKGDVPRDRVALESFPGVGRKTANVVLAYAFSIPALAVDTHVHRVANRLGLAASRKPLETERQLVRLLPRERWIPIHQQLIWHGRRVCRARRPLCSECPLIEDCLYGRQQRSP
ncbi:endonuclease III [Pasteuria penetrans]|uniref:endonuclease III n=1 Tax=Pasteuria penetrans TaxID=86005 RepID=UPI000F932E99|nr:endonuclease III [Pasteuria penetrans]